MGFRIIYIKIIRKIGLLTLILMQIPDRQLKSGVIREPLALSKTDLILIDTKEKLETLRDTLCSVEEFAVDLEVLKFYIYFTVIIT